MKRARLLLLLGAALLLVPVSSHAVATEEVTFPSASSTVVGSTGIVDADEIGYFWSVARGDSVAESFSTSLSSIEAVTMNFNVPSNILTGGAQVDWVISINGIDVGFFAVQEGQTGARTVDATFPAIDGPDYDVEIRVINEVPLGFGAHTLTYVGSDPHSVLFWGTNTCDDTSNPDEDEDGLVSEPVHNGVEPLVPVLTPTVHRVNCQVVVPLGL